MSTLKELNERLTIVENNLFVPGHFRGAEAECKSILNHREAQVSFKIVVGVGLLGHVSRDGVAGKLGWRLCLTRFTISQVLSVDVELIGVSRVIKTSSHARFASASRCDTFPVAEHTV
eukprot:1164788-Amorphochlora_amoeboformis.AAC.1